MKWNETYMLRSLLTNSRNYKICIHPHDLMAVDRNQFASSDWQFITSDGSIYLEKASHGE